MKIGESRKITLELTELEASFLANAVGYLDGYAVSYEYERPFDGAYCLSPRTPSPSFTHEDLKGFIEAMSAFVARFRPIQNLRFSHR